MSDILLRRIGAPDITKGTVLVVGGAGYVGSHAAKELLRCGYRPVVYDNLSSSSYPVSKFGPFERGDLRDGERLSQIFKIHKPVAVVHCATSRFFAKSYHDPMEIYGNIAIGTLNLLEIMRQASVTDLCIITNASVYGANSALNIPEQTPTEPLTAFGACLNAVENMIGDFSLHHELRWISLRLFNVGGADLESELGENHPNEIGLIPIAIDAILGRRNHVPIRGSHFPTRDGSALRDFVHVKDVASAIVLSLDHLARQDGLGPYNIGTGREVSVLEIIHAIEQISGQKCPVRYEAKVGSEPFALSADFERARLELGWEPRNSQILDLLSSAFEFRKHFWAKQSRPSRPDDLVHDTVVIQHAEPMTEMARSAIEHDVLLEKLDSFLKR